MDTNKLESIPSSAFVHEFSNKVRGIFTALDTIELKMIAKDYEGIIEFLSLIKEENCKSNIELLLLELRKRMEK